MTPWWNPFEWFSGPPAEVPGAAPAPATGALRVLTVGVNRLDRNFWGGSEGLLSGCANDARDVARACANAVSRVVLTGIDLGPIEFRRAVRDLAEASRPGDRVVIWYSGHGGNDLGGDPGELKSEYLCLPRGPYPEWDLQEDLRSFRPGVSVFYGSDSCYSAGQVRSASMSHGFLGTPKPKSLSFEVLSWVSNHYRERFRAARAALESRGDMIRASELPDVAAFLGCGPDEVSYDGRENGAATGAFLDAFRRIPGGSPRKIHAAGPARLTRQHPQIDAVTPGGERVLDARAFA